MAVSLEQFIKQLGDSGLIPANVLERFVPPAANPNSAEELARELIRQSSVTKFQAEEISRGRGKSLTLGNYVLLDKIGQGGMGAVFKAQHRRMKRIVAVKMLPADMMKDAAAANRFQREVEAAAKLRHTNIIAADDADEANGVHFLVMEFVEGRDLAALVKKEGPFPPEKAIDIVVQAARGLEYAHQCGVIHRDIKPANLLINAHGTVKILDMGLARIEGITGSHAELTSTGAVMGTVDYMAPEQALSTKNADARSDIYSLGITLWYLLTARAIYDGDSLMAKLLAHRDNPIPALTDHSNVSPSVDAVFRQMVAKTPSERYQSMAEVLAGLQACQSGEQPGRATVDVRSPKDKQTSLELSRRRAATTIKRKLTASSVLTDSLPPTVASNDLEVPTNLELPELVRKKGGRRKKGPNPKRPWWKSISGLMAGLGGALTLVLIVIGLNRRPEMQALPVPSSIASKQSTAISSAPIQNLLSGIDPERDAIEGVWTRYGSDLVSPVQAFGQIGIAANVPQEYRLAIDVTREAGIGPLVIGLPIGASRCVATIDLQPSTHAARLEQNPVGPNTASSVGSLTSGLPIDGRSHLECEVRPHSIEVTLDGKSILKFAGDPATFKTPGEWQVNDMTRAFLGATFSRFRIRGITLEALPVTPVPALGP